MEKKGDKSEKETEKKPAKKSAKEKPGRKTKWDTVVKPKLKLIEAWCRDGLIEKEICKRLGIAVTTFNKYKKVNEVLRIALQNGKEEVDYMVEDALLKKCLGYTIEEKSTKENKLTGEIITTTTTKIIPPDSTAIIFWSKNRRSDKWNDKRKIEVETNENKEIDYKSMTDDELIEEAKRLKMSDEEVEILLGAK